MSNGLTPAAMAAILREKPHNELYLVNVRRGPTPILAINGGAQHVAKRLEELKGPDLTVSRVMLVENDGAG